MKHHMIQDQLALEKLQQFLQTNKLPFRDVKLEGSLYFTYEDENHTIIGSGGLELYGKHALLRSLAVEEKHRNKKLGLSIVNDLMTKARSLNIENLFLLTETAREFFEKKGFQDIERTEVPEVLRNSSEFTSVCPSTATCMLYKLSL